MKPLLAISFALIGLGVAGCSDSAESTSAVEPTPQPEPQEPILMEIGTLLIELYPEKAPATVAQISGLIDDGFYDSQRIHRVDFEPDGVKCWVVQWGDPQSKDPNWQRLPVGSRGSGNPLPFEENDITLEPGVIAMASTGAGVGGDSQMFILGNGVSQPNLDFLQGSYAAFGRVVESMDLVDIIQRGDVIDMNVLQEESDETTVRIEMKVSREQ